MAAANLVILQSIPFLSEVYGMSFQRFGGVVGIGLRHMIE